MCLLSFSTRLRQKQGFTGKNDFMLYRSDVGFNACFKSKQSITILIIDTLHGKNQAKTQMRIIAMMQSRTTVLSSRYSVDLILTVCNTGCIKRIFQSALILHPFTGNDRNTPLKRGDSWSLHGHRLTQILTLYVKQSLLHLTAKVHYL